jgi:hypothetical protein
MRKVWKVMSGVRTTSWLIVAAIVLLLTGSLYVKANTPGFDLLNNSLMQDWFRGRGSRNAEKTWWFFTLIGVLFLLGLNTMCCVLDRLAFHWSRRGLMGTRLFLFKVTPTIIHACFAFMLAGHFASMGIGYRSRDMDFVSRPGKTVQYTLPKDVKMTVGPPECEFYSGPFRGKMRQCRIELRFSVDGATVLKDVAIARPLLWNGYQIHMSQIMGKERSAPFTTPDFQLLIKRDPGLRIIMICFPILIFLTLFFYIGEKTSNENGIEIGSFTRLARPPAATKVSRS